LHFSQWVELEGKLVGVVDGDGDGELVGVVDGDGDGEWEGVGNGVDDSDGDLEGVGDRVGEFEGVSEGVCDLEGESEGVGDREGEDEGVVVRVGDLEGVGDGTGITDTSSSSQAPASCWPSKLSLLVVEVALQKYVLGTRVGKVSLTASTWPGPSHSLHLTTSSTSSLADSKT
jgi:hypothetical protein